jgi:CAAX prenyl protease-like protein
LAAPQTSQNNRKSGLRAFIDSDDFAYISPMAAFLLITWIGGHWPALYPASYVAKTIAAAALLWIFRHRYTKIRWNYVWLGVIVGIIGVVQWVGMEKLLLHLWPDYPKPTVKLFIPHEHFDSPALMWTFIIIRWVGPTLVVPVMEELFWRDYLWRTILAPNDFKLAAVGEWDWKPFLFVSLAFAAVHVQWMTAIVWGLMIAGLLVYTKSLGACIIAHGVTNLLLGAYVLYTKDWYFW